MATDGGVGTVPVGGDGGVGGLAGSGVKALENQLAERERQAVLADASVMAVKILGAREAAVSAEALHGPNGLGGAGRRGGDWEAIVEVGGQRRRLKLGAADSGLQYKLGPCLDGAAGDASANRYSQSCKSR